MMLTITIDMDGPAEYAALHGCPPPTCDPLSMYDAPLDRFVRLCDAVAARGTVFVIGRDLGERTATKLRMLHDHGFEIASHSFTHDYHLSRRSAAEIEADLERSRRAHERALGVSPRGFRAPGYHVSASLLDALETVGFEYSSSVFPSPPYYLAKALVLAGYRVSQRASVALLGSPRLVLAPSQPYRPGDDPYRRGCRRLVELPVSVATPARLPVTGASVVLAPAWVRNLCRRDLCARATVVLNLHAMDLVDPSRDGLPESLSGRQPELRIPVAARLALLESFLRELGESHAPVTCEQLATTVGE